MTDEEHKALVVRPSTAVGRVSAGAGSVLSRVVSDALILARSHSLASARFRVGSYEWSTGRPAPDGRILCDHAVLAVKDVVACRECLHAI